MSRFRVSLMASIAVLVGVQAGCAPRNDEGSSMKSLEIEFLTRPGCRNSTTALAELHAAIDRLALDAAPVIVDLGDLSKDDDRTGYGTPTILVNGLDLFGMPRPEPASPG